jgi:hypothetical protein
LGMTDVEQFIARARAYCAARNVSPSTLSRKLLGNGNRLGELESGKSLRVDTLIRAQGRLAAMECAKPSGTVKMQKAA